MNYGGATPYHARFGVQPAMLPPLDTPPIATGAGGPGRDIARTREVALQKIVESTAIARVNRAERTRTSAAGEAFDYHPGDLVDYHRPPIRRMFPLGMVLRGSYRIY